MQPKPSAGHKQNKTMERKEPLLTINLIAFGIVVVLLVGIVVILWWVVWSNEGLLFGMMLAFLFPVLLVAAAAGVLAYIALFALNGWITLHRIKLHTSSRQLGYAWLTFGGMTIVTILIAAISGLVSVPLVSILAETLRTSNPFLTRPVRSVPTYPSFVWQDQSQYDEVGKTLFRSYNVPNSHPDKVVEWYQDVFSEPPWSVVQVNQHRDYNDYTGETYIRYCIQAQHDEGNGQQRTYYLEVFGEDSTSLQEVHVNIGTPNPITDVCERYLQP